MGGHSVLVYAMIYLAAAVLCVPLARKLNLGSVLGYLFAGVLIGPFVLNVIGREGQDVMHYAEFGVVMMLFLIGLELEPHLLWRLRKSIIGLGSLQMIISTIVIGSIAWLAGMKMQQAVATGLILAMSSTAMVMQTLREKGLMKSVAGQSAFSVLLFQDIAVVPILAMLPLLQNLPLISDPETHASNWVHDQTPVVHALFVLGSVTAIVLLGRLIIPPLLRIVAKTRVREVFTATALLIVIGFAALMIQVGASPALGAFLAGVVLANSEYRHELESDIDPFKGLLLGLFFISVGSAIDFNLIATNPLTIILWVLGLMTVKTIVLLVLGKAFGITTDQNLIFALSLSQMGEFAFVLLSFSLQGGILPPETVSLFISVVTISMALTPPLMLLNEKFILPHFGTKQTPEKTADQIDEKNPVIIAGFGHFGSTIGRFLRANKINATYLDIDSDRVDALRRMGLKVFYGDASRQELLQAAGAEEARIIIIAIDNPKKRVEMIETIKKHFPNLHIMCRARNRHDAYDLMNRGLMHIYRETVDTSLRLGVDTMRLLGYRAYTAKRLARTFMHHDEANLKHLASIHNKDEYITKARKYIEEIETIIQADAQGPILKDSGWELENAKEDQQSLI